jgi:Transposase IS116/IS110/IS902 family
VKGDVRRFDNAKALSAFLGVTPKRKESGSSLKGRSSFSRTGHTAMRKALYMPALVALRHNPLVKTFGDRIKLTGLAPKAVVGACMHKLAMLIYGVLRSGQPFDVDFEKKACVSRRYLILASRMRKPSYACFLRCRFHRQFQLKASSVRRTVRTNLEGHRSEPSVETVAITRPDTRCGSY